MRTLPPLERFVRRSRVYSGRVARMMTQATLRHPCAFMHVPKCGGTSLSEALYSLVPLNRKIGILDAPSSRRALSIYFDDVNDLRPYHDEANNADRVAAFREQLLLMHMAHECDLIHGHFLFSDKAYRHFGDRYKFVTILRDPIERTISNYRMAAGAGMFVGSFDDFLVSAMGRRMAMHNLRYFSGLANVGEGEEPAALQAAETNMRRFSVIGFIEDQNVFLDKFQAIFGRRPKIGHVNKAGSKELSLGASQRQALEKLCGPDIELLELARKIA
jgi:hypothetical protein